MPKIVTVDLDMELSRFIGQERARIKATYGIAVSTGDILVTLLEQHRVRVMNAAKEDKSVLWCYQRLKEREIDIAAKAAKAAKAPRSLPGRTDNKNQKT